jgi:hypothetical protein
MNTVANRQMKWADILIRITRNKIKRADQFQNGFTLK